MNSLINPHGLIECFLFNVQQQIYHAYSGLEQAQQYMKWKGITFDRNWESM
jgi:tRNA U34 5-carboxymethylaminomethyl modifying enzyme MnmG/GidA